MKAQKTYPVEEIIRNFQIRGGRFLCQPYGSGHINDTFLVRNIGGGTDYLLQRINHQVFTNVEVLMDNIWRVTHHIQQKLALPENESSNFETVSIIPATQGKLYFQDANGLFWRMLTFVPHSTSYDVVRSEAQAFQAGKAFGKFQALLYDLPGEELKETIPDFHNMESRFEKFFQALEADLAGRRSSVEKEINFVLERQQEMLDMYQHIKKGDLPLRITHNDTKFNNVLLDQETQQAVCVIDLDTVMPGVVHFDFGDAVRTIANTAAEDEKDIKKIKVNLQFYEAFAKGYLQEAGFFLTKVEIEYLAFSSHYMTFIMGLRFLTDYLFGDVYYKIHHPEHNIQRVRAQFELLNCMEKLHPTMKAIIYQLVNTNQSDYQEV